jgi:hypothetical protein
MDLPTSTQNDIDAATMAYAQRLEDDPAFRDEVISSHIATLVTEMDRSLKQVSRLMAKRTTLNGNGEQETLLDIAWRLEQLRKGSNMAAGLNLT